MIQIVDIQHNLKVFKLSYRPPPQKKTTKKPTISVIIKNIQSYRKKCYLQIYFLDLDLIKSHSPI